MLEATGCRRPAAVVCIFHHHPSYSFAPIDLPALVPRCAVQVQILFLTLLSGSFFLFAREFFTLLPLPGVPAWHM